VIYVATENNTIYAIDALSGTILTRQNLGPPVPVQALIGAFNNGPNVGINSTPTIDVLVLPDQPGPVPHLAVAAGKDGGLFILNRDDRGLIAPMSPRT
jgi:hypothetical protein